MTLIQIAPLAAQDIEDLRIRLARCKATRDECERKLQGEYEGDLGALQGYLDNHCAVLDLEEELARNEGTETV